MGYSVINPSANSEAIRTNWKTYHLINIIALSTAVPMWFLTPFLTRNPEGNGWHKFFRFSSIGYALIASGVSIHLSNQLGKLKPKIDALNKREQAEFKHSLASDLFLAQSTNTAIAQFILTERSSSLSSEKLQDCNSLEPIPDEESSENYEEVPNRVTTSELTSSKVTGTSELRNQTSEPQLSSEAEQYIDDVVDAFEDGLTDTEIIKKVLGLSGRNYQKGKKILDEIKRFLELGDDDE